MSILHELTLTFITAAGAVLTAAWLPHILSVVVF